MTDTPSPELRTLIVDDEPLAVERMQVICARLPELRVIGTASDGAAALRLIEALSPELVLLDLTMPEVDGLAVARKLAKQPRRPAVIFVTAHEHFAVEAFDLDAEPAEPGGLLATAKQKGSELMGRFHEPGLLLLADLRHLHREAAVVSLDWEVLLQTAKALKDSELQKLAEDCHPETVRQMKWAEAKLKESAAQIMVTG